MEIVKKPSIGSRLTLWYLAIFAAAQLLFGVAMWVALRQELYTVADDALKAQIEDLTNFLKSQKKKNMTVTKLREEASEAYDLEHSGDFLQIYDEDGNWIFRAPALVNRFAPAAPAAITRRFGMSNSRASPSVLLRKELKSMGASTRCKQACPPVRSLPR
jgi:hypothetical protein